MNPKLKLEFLARLTALPETDPLWVGLKQLISDISNDTVMASCRPGLTADDRSYNDGRQAAAMDLSHALDDAWEKAHQPPG